MSKKKDSQFVDEDFTHIEVSKIVLKRNSCYEITVGIGVKKIIQQSFSVRFVSSSGANPKMLNFERLNAIKSDNVGQFEKTIATTVQIPFNQLITAKEIL